MQFLSLLTRTLNNTQNDTLKHQRLADSWNEITYFCMTCHHSPRWSQSCSDRSVLCSCCWADRCANSPPAFHMGPLHMRGFWLRRVKTSTIQIHLEQDNYIHQHVESLDRKKKKREFVSHYIMSQNITIKESVVSRWHPKQTRNPKGHTTAIKPLPSLRAISSLSKLLRVICQVAPPWGSWHFPLFLFVAFVHLVGWVFLRTEVNPMPTQFNSLRQHLSGAEATEQSEPCSVCPYLYSWNRNPAAEAKEYPSLKFTFSNVWF